MVFHAGQQPFVLILSAVWTMLNPPPARCQQKILSLLCLLRYILRPFQNCEAMLHIYPIKLDTNENTITYLCLLLMWTPITFSRVILYFPCKMTHILHISQHSHLSVESLAHLICEQHPCRKCHCTHRVGCKSAALHWTKHLTAEKRGRTLSLYQWLT